LKDRSVIGNFHQKKGRTSTFRQYICLSTNASSTGIWSDTEFD